MFGRTWCDSTPWSISERAANLALRSPHEATLYRTMLFGMLRRFFISNFFAWRTGMDHFEELDEDSQLEFSAFLTDTRVRLRRAARVLVAKNALPRRGVADREIDMETALSFLD